MQRGKYIRKLKKDARRNLLNSRQCNDLAIWHLVKHKAKLALHYFQQADAISGDIQSKNNLAWFYLNEGSYMKKGWRERPDKAVEILEPFICQNINSSFPYAVLGEACLKIGAFQIAEQCLRIAVEKKEDKVIQYNLGVALYNQSRLEEALEWFFKSIDPQNEFSLLSSGICLARLGKIRDAENIAKNLERDMLEISDIICVDDIAQIYYLTSNYVKAIELLSTAKKGLNEFYLFSLIQLDRVSEAEALMEKDWDYFKGYIQLLENCKYENFNEGYRLWFIEELESEISDLEIKFEKMKTESYKPELNYQPPILSSCYLFGCKDHQHSWDLEIEAD